MNAVEAEFLAVGEQADEVAGVLTAGDDNDVANARVHQRLDGVKDHRPVINGKQMFVGDARKGIKPRALTAGEHNTFHRRVSPGRKSRTLKYSGLINLEVPRMGVESAAGMARVLESLQLNLAARELRKRLTGLVGKRGGGV